MFFSSGYEDFVRIHISTNSQVYCARRTSDRSSVILKFLAREYPSSEQIRCYKQEYNLIRQLDSPRIIKVYRLEQEQQNYVLILEDFGGISLKQWLKQGKKLSIEEFIAIAIAIAESLEQIHAQNIIHKDINPANIVFNPDTKELKIIDFGIATQLSRENPTPHHPNILEGTLPYISPEQTGRMNRGLDYRTDFYSLGVTFYELLAGQLPFTTKDALELVHCHLTKTPPQFQTPPILQEIVRKLIAKNAEDRYQSAWGLKADLEHCKRQLEETGELALFPFGRQDISDRFQISQKLYGREREIETLLAAFERVAGDRNIRPQSDILSLNFPIPKRNKREVGLMLVSGDSGIGKSSLIRELYKPITARRGYFIVGKFDQFQRSIPYSAIVAAFRGLIGQLLAEGEEQLQKWKEKLLKSLGNNGKIIIDVIPEVELIIGKQPDVPSVEANEAQNRFNLVFSNFIGIFCSQAPPLVLFLDDLQWADLATLKLIERLLREEQNQYLFLLGAYRDNEVFLGHPLRLVLDKLQHDQSEKISEIALQPLSEHEIARLIGDTIRQTPEATRNLARLVLQKNNGNPFFANEFLQALYDEDLLKFEEKTNSWQWDISEIEKREFTKNVVGLMTDKLRKLPTSHQEILSLAAC
ncbi:MAG: AAA family ATPase [Cyanobacteria bacterium P01_E01_bin.42]